MQNEPRPFPDRTAAGVDELSWNGERVEPGPRLETFEVYWLKFNTVNGMHGNRTTPA
jgi:hypothetical protein